MSTKQKIESTFASADFTPTETLLERSISLKMHSNDKKLAVLEVKKRPLNTISDLSGTVHEGLNDLPREGF